MSFALSGCQLDDDVRSDWDTRLSQTLEDAANGRGLEYFQLPSSDDFSAIPQDPRNPITRHKVNLGRMLFHETALGVNPRIPGNENRYSCASCHHAGGGFQANLLQGIGEGGIGYGYAGEGRVPDPTTVLDSIDVQQIRTPSALNIAYQACILWNGQFGGTGPNAGTEVGWVPGKPTYTNYLGYEGTETQAIAGLKVHRMDIDSAILMAASPDYAPLFAYAFPEVPENERYDREHAGLAIAAYERTLLANQAPFQKWLRGDYSAMRSDEKEGAILFFSTARCYVCHTGPALSSMEFYGLGMP
jgi:cytochrome c peroxidase